jgi:carbohydrate-selective porin OprB
VRFNGLRNGHHVTYRSKLILISYLFLSGAQFSFAQSSDWMFGDWGGDRTRLENQGIVFHFLSVNDFLVDTRADAANWSRVRGTVDIDFGKLELVQGLSFHITGLWQGGGNMGAYIGSIANPSSLVSANTARLDSWWFEQAMANRRLFIRLGQFAGEDFYGVQAGGGAYVIEPLGYALGNLNSADYETFDPAATPAAEIRVVPIKNFYLKSAVFSSNRNAYGDDRNGLHFRFRDQPVVAAEAGYLIDRDPSSTRKTYPGSYQFGATTNPGPFANLGTGARTSGNYLLYAMANQALYRHEAGSDRGLDMNLAFDWAPQNVTRVYSQLTGGLANHGPFARRKRDTAAFGVVYSRVSDIVNRAGGSEKAVEANYSIQVTRWFSFQPVFQYYFDTGANPQMRNSTVAGFRTSFKL